jgi:hypothetical protein
MPFLTKCWQFNPQLTDCASMLESMLGSRDKGAKFGQGNECSRLGATTKLSSLTYGCFGLLSNNEKKTPAYAKGRQY